MDFDLALAILLFAEENNGGVVITVADLPEQFHYVNESVLREHVIDAVNQGFLKADITFGHCYIDRLTPAGRKLLATQRANPLPATTPVEVQRTDSIVKRAWDAWLIDILKRGFWLIACALAATIGFILFRLFG